CCEQQDETQSQYDGLHPAGANASQADAHSSLPPIPVKSRSRRVRLTATVCPSSSPAMTWLNISPLTPSATGTSCSVPSSRSTLATVSPLAESTRIAQFGTSNTSWSRCVTIEAVAVMPASSG